jgi:geranylgeranyl diphosphate synthase type I
MGSGGENMLERIEKDRQKICDFLDGYLDEWEEMEPGRWRTDVKERMQEMVKGGKMVRGSLVMETHLFCGGESIDDCLRVAGAIELLHTGLLMHDDIVDKDDYRREMPTFSKQYSELGEEENVSEPEHFGKSMAIVAADISFFMGQGLLSRLEIDPTKRREVIELVFEEFSSVGLAEQVDIYSGYAPEELTEEEIKRLYRDKTARYTFSLPFKAGALMAGADEEEIDRLYRLGEKLGIVFQLKDDELGLFGSEEETGKSLGSDLEENKKTLHRLRLLEKIPEDEKDEMRERLSGDLSRQEKREVVERIEDLGVREEVRERMEEIAEEAKEDIEELRIDEEARDFLRELTDFCLERSR